MWVSPGVHHQKLMFVLILLQSATTALAMQTVPDLSDFIYTSPVHLSTAPTSPDRLHKGGTSRSEMRHPLLAQPGLPTRRSCDPQLWHRSSRLLQSSLRRCPAFSVRQTAPRLRFKSHWAYRSVFRALHFGHLVHVPARHRRRKASAHRHRPSVRILSASPGGTGLTTWGGPGFWT